jgi:hypothetical protein
MKKSISILSIGLILSLLMTQCKKDNQSGITINGNIENTTGDLILLQHYPQLRGNFNFDGFKSISTKTDNTGNFQLHSNRITHAADYSICIEGKWLSLTLFNGDVLEINTNSNTPSSPIFVKGKGAAKINILNLEQFKYHNPSATTIEEFEFEIDSIIQKQLILLDAIKDNNLKHEIIINADNRNKIERIISENTLSDGEYYFLRQKINNKRTNIIEFISNQYYSDLLDSIKINYRSSFMNKLNDFNFNTAFGLNSNSFNRGFENWILFQYLKEQNEIGNGINFVNFRDSEQRKNFQNWKTDFIAKTINPEISDRYYAESYTWYLLMGDDSQKEFQRLKANSISKTFLDKVNSFKALIDYGLSNTEFQLNDKSKGLSPKSLDSLIKSNNSKPIYLNFWSARFAGSSILPNLPASLIFERDNNDKLRFINVCVDEAKYKGLWAAKVIDNNWKSEHYFFPSDNLDSIKNLFELPNLNTFCYSGASFSLIDLKGNITNNVESPLYLTKEKLNEYIKTVR